MVPLAGGTLRVVAGEYKGTRGPANTFTPVNLFDLRLQPGGRAELELPEGYNTAVVLLNGNVLVNGQQGFEGEAKIATFDTQGLGTWTR